LEKERRETIKIETAVDFIFFHAPLLSFSPCALSPFLPSSQQSRDEIAIFLIDPAF